MIEISSRQHESVMMVVQNNDQQTLTVRGVNDTLQALLGHETFPEDAPFVDFLGEKTRLLVEEDIEFEGDARDVMQVLSRHRALHLLRADGVEVPMQCKVTRSIAEGSMSFDWCFTHQTMSTHAKH
jgi:hypothetical protein